MTVGPTDGQKLHFQGRAEKRCPEWKPISEISLKGCIEGIELVDPVYPSAGISIFLKPSYFN